MITERQMITAQPLRAIRGHTEQMNVEHGACVRRHDQIAMEPVAFRLFGAEQKKMIGEPLNALQRELIAQKQIAKLMRRDHDLDRARLRFFSRNLINEKLRLTTGIPEPSAKQLSNFADKQVRF